MCAQESVVGKFFCFCAEFYWRTRLVGRGVVELFLQLLQLLLVEPRIQCLLVGLCPLAKVFPERLRVARVARRRRRRRRSTIDTNFVLNFIHTSTSTHQQHIIIIMKSDEKAQK
jgi:hypothetical protein